MDELGPALLREAHRRVFVECEPRVTQCLERLTDEQIWSRPNEVSNSVGNLVLHLCGNVRQWTIHGLGGAPDNRERDAEFAARGPVPRADLLARLRETFAAARRVLDELDPSTLLEARRIQGFDETVLSVLVHQIEHTAYHTGQIAWITKTLTNGDLGFYAGQDLNAKD